MQDTRVCCRDFLGESPFLLAQGSCASEIWDSSCFLSIPKAVPAVDPRNINSGVCGAKAAALRPPPCSRSAQHHPWTNRAPKAQREEAARDDGKGSSCRLQPQKKRNKRAGLTSLLPFFPLIVSLVRRVCLERPRGWIPLHFSGRRG